MNTRQGVLVTLFGASLFMNFAANIWTMWSVLTASLFMLMVTDFMFFAVRASPASPSRLCVDRSLRVLRVLPRRHAACGSWAKRPDALSRRTPLPL